MKQAVGQRMDEVEQDDPAKVGMWEPIQYRFNYLPIHLALLHTGKVLAFGGSGNDEDHLKTPHPSEIWDPHTGETRIIDQELAGDIFCVGHAFLPDGRLLVAGGTYKYDRKLFNRLAFPPFRGLNQAYLFDPSTETWERVEDMRNGRWYPTLITLGDGRVLAMAGLTQHFPWAFLREIEIYSSDIGWRKLEGADRWLPLYPRLHLLPDGDVFYSGSYNTHYTFPYTIKSFPTATLNVATGKWTIISLPHQCQREEGAAILLPLVPPEYRAKVLLIGGGTPGGIQAVSDVEIIDLSESNPRWRSTQPMQHSRYYVYAVILPDRQVFVIGGRKGHHSHHPSRNLGREGKQGHANGSGDHEVPRDPRAIHETELFNPDTEKWTRMAPMSLDRLYHSNALLLPDGRVMVAGSNPERRINELHIEIYHPPYLCRGPRPQIEEAPSEVSYGQEFEIETSEANDIEAVALIRPSATTHCLNTEERYVGLVFSQRGSGKIIAKIPDNRNLAPPGYYMLFIVRDGIPSVARFVHVD